MIPRRIPRLSRPITFSSPASIRAASSPQTSRLAVVPSTTRRSYAASTTATENAAHKGSDGGEHHGHYDPPGGWLWGIRPGEQHEKEGWENLFLYGFCGSWVVAIIAYSMKEDTSIQTWALEEARRRLEKEGILEESSK